MKRKYSVTRYEDNKNTVSYAGLDMGGRGTIIKENEDTLVIKWPGGSHWVGRGHRSYHPPQIHVLQKPTGVEPKHTLLISWENKRLTTP